MSKLRTTIPLTPPQKLTDASKKLKGDLTKATPTSALKGDLATTTPKAIHETQFHDSHGRQILEGDQITLISESGSINRGFAKTAAVQERTGHLMLAISLENGGRTSIPQSSIYDWPNRITSDTALSQGRAVNEEISAATPKPKPGGLKTTLES